MSNLFLRAMLVAGIGLTGAACQDTNFPAQRGYNQPAQGYNQPAQGYNPYYNNNNNNASNQQRNGYNQTPATYNQADGRRYTTVTVTNRGQNGYRDDVVQQQVVCGSQYNDGFRNRTAPTC